MALRTFASSTMGMRSNQTGAGRIGGPAFSIAGRGGRGTSKTITRTDLSAGASGRVWPGLPSARSASSCAARMPPLRARHARVSAIIDDSDPRLRISWIDEVPINAAAQPDFAIVDGIMGYGRTWEPKSCGVPVLGNDTVVVNATRCRIYGAYP